MKITDAHILLCLLLSYGLICLVLGQPKQKNDSTANLKRLQPDLLLVPDDCKLVSEAK
jgi:hypothetical protein